MSEGTLIVRAASAPLFDSVARGPTGAPTAFRIWKAGDNQTDFGVHRFTEGSAKLLFAEQAKRGNLCSIDVDHLSVDNSRAPPEARKAVGWHRLDVRESADGPELWAVDVSWTDAVRPGLEARPPEWRYVSAAYNVNKTSGEIVSYLNTALTNNPATGGVTALASRDDGSRAASTIERAALEHGPMRAARLAPNEHEALAARMGRDARPKGVHWEGNALVFPTLDKEEVRAFLASRRGAR